LLELSEFVSRYHADRDPFTARGPIHSLRHLISRVQAIGAGFREADIDPRLARATEAPGFDFPALQRMHQDPRFEELLEGSFDERQPFQPDRQEIMVQPLAHLVDEALGSRKRGVPGRAQRTGALFHKLKHLLKDRKSSQSVVDLTKQVPDELTEPVAALLAEHGVTPEEALVVELHAKSDPEGWVTGNYTDSCMPFGDTKTTDYMFNPGAQFFTVQYRGRTIATSVVIDCQDRQSGQRTVLLDNIEIANNYKSMQPAIEEAYRTFWKEYTGRRIVLGAREKDPTLQGTHLIGARIKPIHPVLYSDAYSGSIYEIQEAA
jgi:hypothetical protein